MPVNHSLLQYLSSTLLIAVEQRRDLLIALALGKTPDVKEYLRAADELILALADHWPDLRDRVATTIPNKLVFPRRDH